MNCSPCPDPPFRVRAAPISEEIIVTVLDWCRRSRERVTDHEQREALRWAFRESCVGAGVALAVDGPVAGSGYRALEVVQIVLGPPVRITARMPEGMIPAQLARAGRL